MYISAIHGLVTRDSCSERRKNLDQLGFVNARESGRTPLFMRPPSPKPTDLGFLLSAGTPQSGLANGPCPGRTHIRMRLLTSRRENLLGVSQERANVVIVTLRPCAMVARKSNLDLFGVVVLNNRMAKVGGYHPLGLSHGSPSNARPLR